MPGIPLGCRILMNLALAAEAHGGCSAPGRLVVLLHLNERQVQQALQQLASFNFCGLNPANVWIMIQRRRPAYRPSDPVASPMQQQFVPEEGSPLRGLGSGHAMLQLNWVGEALVMDKQGVLTPLTHTVVEGLEERGIK